MRTARRTPKARILINSGALTVVAAVTLSGCSSDSTAVEKPVNLNAQKELTVPELAPAHMIVPPAPTVPELPAVERVTDKKTKNNGDAPISPGNDTKVTDDNDLYPRADDKSVGDKRGTGEPVTKNGVTNGFVAKLTGSNSVDHTDTKWGVSGAGNAVLWDNGNGQVITMFGDTFGGPRPRGEGSDQAPLVSGDGLNLPVMPKGVSFPALPYVNLHQGGKQGSGFAGDTGTAGPTGLDWRANTLAYSSTKDLGKFSFSEFVTDKSKHAKELISARRVDGTEITTMPTSGISIGGKQYLTYASIRQYGPAPGSWTSNYSGIAVSTDNGNSWRKATRTYWTNSGAARNFQMPALAKRGNTIYMFGTEQGRVGGVYVAKVPANKILDKSAYRYWTNGRWVRGLRAEPTAVVSGGVGEVSVVWNSTLKRWLMIATDVFHNGIVLRQAAHPQGPWSSAQVIASGSDYPSIYGASIHPWSKGNDLYFTMSQWSSYNVYLMHATVTRSAIGRNRSGSPEIPLPGGGRLPAGVAPDVSVGNLPSLILPKSMQGSSPNPRAPRGPGK
ncbi:MAG: DUF4185 domain-containing protein [Gordonia amarae]